MSSLPSVNLNALYAAAGSSATGIDVAAAVNQILYAKRSTERQWQSQQSIIDQQTFALNQLNSAASSLMDALNVLQDTHGALANSSVSSTQTSVVTATAAPGTSTGTHVVEVENLAMTAAWYSDPVKDSNTPFAAGSFDLTTGSGSTQTTTAIMVGSGVNTPADLVAYINGRNLGITASLVNDANGTRVTLVSTSSGSAGDFSISPTPEVSTTNMFTRATSGVNASLNVDGVPISSATNSVSGAIPGVTMRLNSQAPGSPVILSVQSDSASATEAIARFVFAYNSLITNVNQQFAYNAADQSSGPLGGDTTVRMLQQGLLAAPSYSVSGSSVSTLRSMGVTMNDDGTLTIDSAALNAALANNPGAVKSFFQGASDDGFAANLNSVLDTYADPVSGAFTVDLKSLSDNRADLQDHIDDFERYLSGEQARLTYEYNQIDMILLQLPQQQKQINAILGYNPSASNNS